jgi:hypothetical protein
MYLVIENITLLLLMVALIAVGIFAYLSQEQYLKEHGEFLSATKDSRRKHRQLTALARQHLDLQHKLRDTEINLAEARAGFAVERARIEQDFLLQQRQQWCKMLQTRRCKSRAEIGARVLYPMLRHLGYPDEAFEVEHPIPSRGLPQVTTVQVSCFVFEMVNNSTARPLFLLQSVEPDVGITDSVRGDVDRDAYAAGASKFALTDGEYFELFRIGPTKRHIVRCRLSELGNEWDHIRTELEPSAFPRTP